VGGDDELRSLQDEVVDPPQRREAVLGGQGGFELVEQLGIIAVAAALRGAIAHPFDRLPLAEAVVLGGGASVFLFGQALFRHTLAIGSVRGRALAAALALATIPIGSQLALTAQISVLVGLFVAMLTAEGRPLTR
jgi:hypothetical protein